MVSARPSVFLATFQGAAHWEGSRRLLDDQRKGDCSECLLFSSEPRQADESRMILFPFLLWTTFTKQRKKDNASE